MTKKKCWIFPAAVLALMLCFAGCSDKQNPQEEENGLSVYYVNPEQTSLEENNYELSQTGDEQQVEELLEVMREIPDAMKFRSALPGNLEVTETRLEDKQLFLTFSESYLEMNSVEEILCRAAIVRTLVQLDGVDVISFYIGEEPLRDADGQLVGVMNADSFVENPEEEINTIQETTLTLYFASLDGQSLVSETQDLHYSSNISLEKLVMERLLAGPTSDYARSALPAETGLVSVSVMEGVCFVNLDEGFLNKNFDVTEEVIIYSIVDSLQELPTINKVQISVNGETNIVYREKFSLNTVYERNLDLLVTSEESLQSAPQAEGGE